MLQPVALHRRVRADHQNCIANVTFCPAGGRGVIEGLGSQLGLSQRQLEPSASTLYWYGNTSSSSLWYALSYIESRQTVKKGDRVWQVCLLPYFFFMQICGCMSQPGWLQYFVCSVLRSSV